ncbi:MULTISPECIES: triose-phosphate isomerase family protein [Microbacterium]|uniref:triose-phosphate isomerase n=1 Tax=Microbacterium TaxID=33882 RepID=UPI00278BAB4C|nr:MULTISPECIES: triose-phosphate isomerase family protein [Microbacterium]MDQ1082706.1 triosephosphate isomerase [Microbacterium sp. SORGH_AS_0344]MDQ1168523.1 triosephosphate isomerase [Microbacterium proteolyticum]
MSVAPVVVAVSFKAYLSHATAIDWVRAVAGAPIPHGVEVVVFPSFLSIPGAVDAAGGRLSIGAQNLHSAEGGAFTGEVTAPQIREVGCRYVEIGHAERENLFGETEADIVEKIRLAQRHGLIPLLCVGEPTPGSAADAAAWCREKVARMLRAAQFAGDIVVAYEPVWAIGAERPADPAHVRTVAAALREALSTAVPSGRSARVIYGGAAGEGTLPELRGDVDGVFLGRFAHDPAAMRRILAEAADSAVAAFEIRG